MAKNTQNQFTRNFMTQMGMYSAQDRTDDSQILAYLQQISADITRLADSDSGPAGPNTNGPRPAGGPPGSQGAARDAASNLGPFGQHHANNLGNFGTDSNRRSKSFADAFEKSLLDSLGGREFKDKLKGALNNFAEALDTDLEHLEEEFGNEMGKMVAQSVKNDKGLGGKLFGGISNKLNSLLGKSGDVASILEKMKAGNAEGGEGYDVTNLIGDIRGLDLGKVGNLFKNGVTGVLGGLEKVAGSSVASAVALKMLDVASEGAQQAMEGLKDMGKALSTSANRYSASREKNIELANERMRADIDTLIQEPFEILKKSADEVYSAWNANVRLIAGTQGYDKADLQDLMSNFAKDLTASGYSKVISSADVYNNLAKVIQSGLSGKVAEEFAYQATLYNAAIPNQDFFSLADTYASVAARAIQAGKTEREALDEANASLQSFANSVLFASRNLVGGYSSGLRDATNIYSMAARISQAAGSEDLTKISDALLAIQGYVGSIAPDLASSLTDKIYQLATGGNAADIVALRSLAGVNASNTEFLRALATNPQDILSSMFANLGVMFNQSSDAYMEKAEGYAQLFGLSAESLQRIDFISLASAIQGMKETSNALEDNLSLLREGQTTTTADQLKIAQINKYMVEEGLSYVIDNEAAQLIQQHMWDEQMKRDLMEAEYGVNLVGGAASALQKIVSGVDKILSILNPAAWFAKGAAVIESITEKANLDADVKQMLELGKVGPRTVGDLTELHNLTTRNSNLQLVQSLVEQMGGTSNYKAGASIVTSVLNAFGNPLQTLTGAVRNLVNHNNLITGTYTEKSGTTANAFGSSNLSGRFGATATNNEISSRYQWGTLGSVSKYAAQLSQALLSATASTQQVSHQIVENVNNTASTSAALVKQKINKMLADDYLVTQYVNQGKTLQQWMESGAQMGLTNMEEALATAGYSQESLEEYFLAKQTEAGVAMKAEQAEQEKLFREAGIRFWNTSFWDMYSTPLNSTMITIISRLDTLIALHGDWRDRQFEKLDSITANQIAWKDYFDTSWISTQWPEFRTQYSQEWVNWKDYFNTAWLEETWKTNFVGESGLFTRFFNEFINKFVEHTYYDASGYTYSDVTDIQRREDAQKGDAVYALADALTSNMVDLKDPQVQTNALLAQILQVVFAIMNQNNSVAGTVSLADTLSGLAVGLTTRTPLTEVPLQ